MANERKIITTVLLASTIAATGIVNAEGNNQSSTSSDQVYPGEFIFNNLEGTDGSSIRAVLDLEFQKDDNPDAKDSFSTSLRNNFGSFSKDPLKEGGLKQTSEDIGMYKDNDAYSILQKRDIYLVDQLVFKNSRTGITSFGFYDYSDARDAIAWLTATASLRAQNPSFASGLTLQEVMDDPSLETEVEARQNSIFSQIQKGFLNMSETKKKKLQSRNPDLTSNSIPTTAVKPDQDETCDVDRDPANIRQSQPQTIRNVKHIVNGTDTFYNENIDSDFEDLMTGSYDPTANKLVVKSFTGRGYSGDKNSNNPVVKGQLFSVVMEEEFPCAIIAPRNVPKPTPKSQPNIPQQPAETPQPGKGPAGDQVNKDGSKPGDRGSGQTGGDAGGTH